MTRVGPLVPARVALNNVPRDGHTLLGFLPLQRFRNRAATDAGFASPGSGCVFGLSQPPDALFRPGPRRSCLVPAALMGFPLQRFVPSRRRVASRRPLPLLASLSTMAHGPRPSPVRFRIAVTSGSPSEERERPSREDVVVSGRAFRGLRSSWKSVLRVSGGWPLVGADPLLGFQPSRVFPLPAFVRPMPPDPLTHFRGGVPKQAVTGAPECQSAGRLAGLSRDCRPSWSFRPRPGTGVPCPDLRRRRARRPGCRTRCRKVDSYRVDNLMPSPQ
jgi:hypothetical protein